MILFRNTIMGGMLCIGLSIFMIALVVDVSAGAEELPSTIELPSDVAIVTHVSGDVTYQNDLEQPEPAKVQAFMKLRQRDLLTLPAESQVKLLFLKDGFQETWKGTVVLKVGKDRCLANRKGVWLTQLPSQKRKLMFDEISTIRGTSFPPFNRGAVATVRSADAPPNIPTPSPTPTPVPVPIELTERENAEIRSTYLNMKKRSEPDDITPELYLLSVYAKYGHYNAIQKIIWKMLVRYPENQVLQQWEEWVNAQSGT